MKNFPEQDQFKDLEKRLAGYSEEPDEMVWQNIDKALRPGKKTFWFPWIDRLSTVVAIGLMGLLINFDFPKELQTNVATGKRSEASTNDEKVIARSTTSDVSISAHKDQMKSEPDLSQDREQSSLSKNDVQGKHKADNLKDDGPSIRRNREVLNAVKKDLLTGSIELSSSENNSSADDESGITSRPDSSGRTSEYGEKSVSATGVLIDSLTVPLQVKQDSLQQKENSPKESKRKISKRGLTFYASLTPQLSFQRVVPVSNDGVVINEVYTESIFSSDRFGFSIDAGLQGHITKRLEYYGGLSLHQQKQTLRYSYQSEGRTTLEQDDDRSYLITPETKTATIQYRMLNVGANLGLLYNLQGKKLAHKIGAGFSYQQGLNKSSTERYNNAESSYLFYRIFYRNEVRVRPRLRVYVQPAFSHSLYTNEKLDAPFTLKPYRAGIGFGILYDF